MPSHPRVLSTGKPVSPKMGKPLSSRSGHGSDPRRFVRAVINPRPATTGLPRGGGLSSSDSGAICFSGLLHATGRLQAMRGRGRGSAVGHGEPHLYQGLHAFPGASGAQTLQGKKPPKSFVPPGTRFITRWLIWSAGGWSIESWGRFAPLAWMRFSMAKAQTFDPGVSD